MKPLLLGTVLVLAAIAIYLPVRNYVFLINIDDDFYVFNNPHVLNALQWKEVLWAFTHSYAKNYDPLTFLAHSLNVRRFGMNAGWHHLVNVGLHALDAVLLFWVLRRSTGFTARSFMVAALFAVHPINVENVAWIAELKTMLSAAFFFLALGAYVWYSQKPRLWRMLVVSFVYGLGLLCKPQIITFPFVLLLWDYWPLHRLLPEENDAAAGTLNTEDYSPCRFAVLLREKIPLFLITAADILLTLHAEAKPELERYTFMIRLGAAFRSYVVYIGKAFWPANLGFNYPHPGYSLRWGEVWLSILALLTITALVLANRRHRYLVVGWFWFLGTMVPTINLVQIDVSAVADRYAYICFVGLFLMVCWGSAEVAQKWALPRYALPALSAAVLVVLSLVSRHQVQFWSDAQSIWERSIEVAPVNPGAESGLAWILARRGENEEALRHLYIAMEESPHDPQFPIWAASLEQQRGDFRKAIALYQMGLSQSKDREKNSQVLSNMGHAYEELGDQTKAIQCYQAAREIRQNLPRNGHN